MFIGSSGRRDYIYNKNEVKKVLKSQGEFDIIRKGRGEFLKISGETRLVPMNLVEKAFKEMRNQENLADPEKEQLAGLAKQLKQLELDKNTEKFKVSEDGSKIKVVGLWNKHFSGAVSRVQTFDRAEKSLSTSIKTSEPRSFLSSLKLNAKNDPQAQFDLAFLYEQGHGVEQNLEKAVKYYKLSAESGNTNAQNRLGELYHHGEGDLKKDLEKSITYYKLAANQGHPVAQNNLGEIYEFLKGGTPFPIADSYAASAKQGNVHGQFNLGRAYESGRIKDGKINHNEAFKYFKLAAAQGHEGAKGYVIRFLEEGKGVEKDLAEAAKYRGMRKKELPSRNLGSLYERGEGVPKDMSKAIEYFRLGALAGDLESQVKLGDYYQENKDTEKAVEFYTLAANQGDPKACYQLGSIYESQNEPAKAREWYLEAALRGDDQVCLKLAEEFRKEGDWEKALYLYSEAEELGNANAKFRLGELYESGEGIGGKDIKIAMRYFEEAGKLGHARALNHLGILYEDVKKDFEKAFECYEMSAELGSKSSQYNLGVIYEDGEGVEVDLVKALKYYKMAAAQGHPDAKIEAERLEKEL